MVTAPGPLTWPSAIYESIVDGTMQFAPATCVEHRGRHAFYLGACVSTPSGEGVRRPTWRSDRCPTCGTATAFVRPHGSRHWRGPFDDRTGEAHRHPPEPEPAPVVVEVACPHPHPRATASGRVGRPLPPPPPVADVPMSEEMAGLLARIPKLHPGGRAYPSPNARPSDHEGSHESPSSARTGFHGVPEPADES